MMPKLTNRVQVNGDRHSVQPCPACEETAQRDAQILATLQTVQRVFNGTDGIKSPLMKLARAKKAFDEIVRLMQPETW